MPNNAYGLSRTIPADVKRAIRIATGFGCVICGNAIGQYEHVDPPFAEARQHDPEKMTFLCAGCHDKVTRGLWSKDKVLDAMAEPFATRSGRSTFTLDIARDADVVVRVGRTRFVGAKDILIVSGKKLLSVARPEELGAPLRIQAQFYDKANTLVAEILDNEWHGSVEAFDIEMVGKSITVRSAQRDIDLKLTLTPPTGIMLEQLSLRYAGTSVVGNSRDGFKVETDTAFYQIPEAQTELQHAPHWVQVVEGKILVGNDQAVRVVAQDGRSGLVPGTIKVSGFRAEEVDAEKEGIPLRPGRPPGSKIMKLTKMVPEGNHASYGIEVPIPRPRPPLLQRQMVSLGPTGAPRRKIGRNQPCPCGSGKKYKYCCGSNLTRGST